MLTRFSKYLPFLYVLFLISGFLYVRGVLKNDSIKVTTKNPVIKLEDKVFPLQATLVFEDSSKDYQLNSNDSVLRLLETARAAGQLYYEKVEYLDHIEIWVNNVKPAYQTEWVVLYNETQVIRSVDREKLIDKGVYTLKKVSLVP